MCKPAITLFCLFLTSLATLAKEVKIPEVGISLNLPADWKYLGTEGQLHVYEGPQGRIRCHLYHAASKTPEEALKFSVAREKELAAESEGEKRPRPVRVLLSSRPFLTKSGIHSVQGAFGIRGYDLPIDVKHFLPNSTGRMVCICACGGKSKEGFAFLENLIIGTVKQIKQKNKKE